MIGEHPFVSIVVPVYNGEKYLGECLDSIISQSFINWELILVDDGSVDSSAEICDYYRTKDSRIIVVHQENQGVTLARKEGVRRAIGKYICFVDADDYLLEGALEHLVLAALDDVEVVIANCQCADLLSCSEYVVKLLENTIPWGPWGKLFLRTLFDEEIFNIPRYFTIGEDLMMQLRIATKIKSRVLCIGTYLYHLRDNIDSVTHTRKYSIEYEQRFISYIIKLTKEFDFNVDASIFKIKMNSLRMLIYNGIKVKYTDNWVVQLIAESKSQTLGYTDRFILYIRNNRICRFILKFKKCIYG